MDSHPQCCGAELGKHSLLLPGPHSSPSSSALSSFCCGIDVLVTQDGDTVIFICLLWNLFSPCRFRRSHPLTLPIQIRRKVLSGLQFPPAKIGFPRKLRTSRQWLAPHLTNPVPLPQSGSCRPQIRSRLYLSCKPRHRTH